MNLSSSEILKIKSERYQVSGGQTSSPSFLNGRKIVSGIYVIECEGRVYIGSAKHVWKRWGEHVNDLRANRHRNDILQKAWHKYGPDRIFFRLLEETMALISREQHYLDLLGGHKSFGGFNLSPTAGSNKGCRDSLRTRELKRIASTGRRHSATTIKLLRRINKGRKHTEETIARLRLVWKGRKHSLETRRKMSAWQIGKKHSKATRRRIAKAMKASRDYVASILAKTYVITSPSGEVITFSNLRRFAIAQGFPWKALYSVHGRGKTSYKGWTGLKCIKPAMTGHFKTL